VDERRYLGPLRLILDATDLGEEFLILFRIEFIELLECFLFLLTLLFVVRDLIRFVRVDIEVFDKFVFPTAAL
jgi:hypothetical protein